MPSGRIDRTNRLTQNRSGACGSSSADFMHLVRLLFDDSKAYAARFDGNCSPYTLCAIPALLSSWRCLVVEYASWWPTDRATLQILAEAGDFPRMLERLGVGEPLRTEALLLNEVRNEIIHPAHLSTGTPDNLPDYLRPLKDRGLLQTTGCSDSDYIFLSQLCSHSLFAWAARVTRDLAECLLCSDSSKWLALKDFLGNYEIDVEE